MPTETKFICVSGATNIDLSGIFEELNGGTSYGTQTKFKVGSVDLTGYFHASTSSEDRPSFNTGFKVNGTDLSTLFRRRGFVGITITTQPTNQTVVNNTSATFSIAATALGTPTYQWYKNSSIISGATSTTYTTGALTTANDTDTYFCRVSYGGSSVDSNSVSTKIKPYIITNPIGGSFNETDGMSLSVVAGGSPTLSYQWYKDGNEISGATSSSYPASGQFSLNSSTAGTYTCKVTSTHDAVGVTSSGATLTIIPPIVTISSFNGQTQFNETNTVQFSSSLSQGTNVTYQWYRNSNIISGATSSTYNFAISSSNTGTYKVRATNGGGFDDSNEITVSIIAPIVTISSTQYIYNNTNAVELTSSLSQGTNVTYQWYGPVGLISGATSSNYVFTMSDSTRGNYYVRATNAGGFDDSNVVTVYMNPIITDDPDTQTVNAGVSVTFSVAAAGGPSLSYQWYENGSAISGATNSSYTFTPTSSDNGKTYYCIVSGVSGITPDTSATATLTVEFAPTIGSVSVDGATVSYNEENFNIGNGNSFTLAASSVNDGQPNATGGWYKWDGANYGIFLSSNLSYSLTQADDSTEYYRFILTNSKGTAQSYEISITTS